MSAMRIAAFVHLQRTLLSRHPTGVGKHINNILPRLAQMAGVELQILAVREELTADDTIPDDSPLCDLPVAVVPWRAGPSRQVGSSAIGRPRRVGPDRSIGSTAQPRRMSRPAKPSSR